MSSLTSSSLCCLLFLDVKPAQSFQTSHRTGNAQTQKAFGSHGTEALSTNTDPVDVILGLFNGTLTVFFVSGWFLRFWEFLAFSRHRRWYWVTQPLCLYSSGAGAAPVALVLHSELFAKIRFSSHRFCFVLSLCLFLEFYVKPWHKAIVLPWFDCI